MSCSSTSLPTPDHAMSPTTHLPSPRRRPNGATTQPDVLEKERSYVFFWDVPGHSKSDIQVTVEDGTMLVIQSNGKRKRDDCDEEGCKYLLIERNGCHKFTRKFRLPEDSNAKTVTAKCEDGVLMVSVDKLPFQLEGRSKAVEVTVV